MKITDRRANAVMEFDKLEIGDVFQQGVHDYMKISSYVHENDGSDYDNALRLSGVEGIEVCHFEPDDLVTYRESELILK